ncbi:MAG: acetolactate synthase large subunit [Myxococcota bacterium]|nr:acetolactate synthase large subunit [Spirochaeta sp.]RPG03714.1 MAG: acetolactate synthase large subunit [Proteobacteria bacterium TMED72]
MNGAHRALEAAHLAGVEVCFANPGTTEMEMVAALDSVNGIRSVLCLFEGVATGAADGYGRMTGKPAMTLVHLGPGFANGIANLHNARRAGTPIVNMIGDHPTWHLSSDSPLTSDIESLASPVSKWVRRSESAGKLVQDTVEAVAVAQSEPSGVASLIISQDAAWDEAPDGLPTVSSPSMGLDEESIQSASRMLKEKGERGALLLGSRALRPSLEAAAQIQSATGCQVFVDTFMARLEGGAGLPGFDAIPYFPEQAIDKLSGLQGIAVVGSRPPVAFFGYKHLNRSSLLPDDCESQVVCGTGVDSGPSLAAIAQELGAPDYAGVPSNPHPAEPDGELNVLSLGQALASVLPEGAIVVNEAATSSLGWVVHSSKAAPHDVLNLTGGAIGQGIPCAVGAAIAAPDRPVVALQADGSGMYTVQGLWSMAREQLNVTVLVCANQAYRILQTELERSGNHDPGPAAMSMTNLSSPELDWTKLAAGMGLPAVRVTRADELVSALKRSLSEPGPSLIEALL